MFYKLLPRGLIGSFPIYAQYRNGERRDALNWRRENENGSSSTCSYVSDEYVIQSSAYSGVVLSQWLGVFRASKRKHA